MHVALGVHNTEILPALFPTTFPLRALLLQPAFQGRTARWKTSPWFTGGFSTWRHAGLTPLRDESDELLRFRLISSPHFLKITVNERENVVARNYSFFFGYSVIQGSGRFLHH